MDIVTPNIITSHAMAWPNFETPFLGNVSYEPHRPGLFFKQISLIPSTNTCIIDGESHHMKIEKEDNLHDRIWFWK